MNTVNLLKIVTLIVILLGSAVGIYLTYAYFDDDIDLFNESGPDFVKKIETETSFDMPDVYRELRYRPESTEGESKNGESYRMRFKLKGESLEKFIGKNSLNDIMEGQFYKGLLCDSNIFQNDSDLEWWQPTQLRDAQCVVIQDQKSDYKIYVYFGTYSWEEEKTLLIYIV